ncbi:SDR family NAD(P)-dependent oxidoreductase [uncultured Sphingomonas sp.]|uniref:SDR family NAD(P)-dependent oxidoreductase n=1 Tax=uncultured Sphingomonas sp. TaxID=158754 RepID=UPI0035CACF74
MDFTSKRAVVTGGASGIGEAAVRMLVGAGARVAIIDTNAAAGDRIAAELGDAVSFWACDIADVEQVGGVVTEIAAWLGGIDLLFNNAGIGKFGTVTDTDAATWDFMIAVNLSGAFHLSKQVLPHMRADGGGAIVNTASICGLAGDYAQTAYNAAKGGLVNFTRSLALDYADDGIRVNAVCPGVIGDTPMTAHMDQLPGGTAPYFERIPLGRFGRAVEVARAMLFLASDDASYITGQALAVDGGLLCHSGLPRIRRLSPKSALER